MSESNRLPIQSESQRIGMFADSCLFANRPLTWILNPLGGTEDFGLDYQAQVKVGNKVHDIFRIQLKGTESPKLNSTGEFFSVDLKASTIRYYQRNTEPVLLVYADLSTDPVPKNCHLYYQWISEELRRIDVTGLPDSQDSLTLRIPTINKLTNFTDLSADIENSIKLAKIGSAINLSLEKKIPELTAEMRMSKLDQLTANFDLRGAAFFDAMTQVPQNSWPSPAPNTMPWFLTEADRNLKKGDTTTAKSLLDSAETLLAQAELLETTEYWFTSGRQKQMEGDDISALLDFQKAAEFPNAPLKYLAAWAEAKIRVHNLTNDFEDLEEVLTRLSSPDPLILGAKAKTLAALGRTNEALEIAKSFDGIDSLIALAIINTMQGDYQAVLDVCEAAERLDDSKYIGPQVFLILKARARFSLALKINSSNQDIEFPPTGPAHANVDALNPVWVDVQTAVLEFERLGWPTNIDYIADIWSSMAIMLGKEKEVLPLIRAAAISRPNFLNLQRGLELVAAHDGELEIALQANRNLPDSDLTLNRRIFLLHTLKRDQECVTVFSDAQKWLDVSHSSYGEAISMAIISAHRLVKSTFVEEWLAKIDSIENLHPYRAIVDYFLAIEINLLSADEALEKLVRRYDELNHPICIAQQLVGLLDPAKDNLAGKCIEVVERIAENSLLGLRTASYLGEAFVTLKRWDDLLEMSTNVLVRFPENDHLLALRAFAQEKLGLTSEALNSLKQLIDRGITDPLAINTYITIAVRCGFADDAITATQNILAKAKSREEKLNCLRLLFNLKHQSTPENSEAIAYAMRFGELCNQSEEIEEGVFLSMISSATLMSSSEYIRSIRTRLETRFSAFFGKFPESKIIRCVLIPDFGDVSAIMNMMEGIVGHNQASADMRAELESELQSGKMPFPFAWRPRHILSHIRDVPTLWEVAKNSNHSERQYHLTMVNLEWKPVPEQELNKKIPILDLISLLLIHDLDLFENIFQIFPKIAIGQATLLQIANGALPILGDGMHQKYQALQQILKNHFNEILQPHRPPSSANVPLDWPSEETQLLADGENFILYSDDLAFRIFCAGERSDFQSLCTLDVINILVAKNFLSSRQAAEKIALLCRWHVSLAIEGQHQLMILPEILNTARSAREGMEIVHHDKNCLSLYQAIWHPDKPLGQLFFEASCLLREFLGSRIPIISIASVLSIWLGEVKLRDGVTESMQCLTLLVGGAALLNPKVDLAVARCLVEVYLALVEIEYIDQMDETKRYTAIFSLGQTAAAVDKDQNLSSVTLLKGKLGQAFSSGTVERDHFEQGYKAAIMDNAQDFTTSKPFDLHA